MKGWVIVATNGVRLVGLLRKPKDFADFMVLEQALEFLPVQTAFTELAPTGQKDQKGQPLMAEVTRLRITGWQLAEPMGYPSIGLRPIPVPQGALVFPVNECMGQADINMLARGIDSFYEAKRTRENTRLIAGAQ